MVGTLISVVFAILLYLSNIGSEVNANLTVIGIALVAVATLFLFLPTHIFTQAWGPLQLAEHNLTPHILQLYRQDRLLRFIHYYMLFFPLASYIIATDILFLHTVSTKILFPVWFILLGIALDCLRSSLVRISKCLDPFQVVEMFTHEAKICIQDERELDLCDWLDAISEVAMRGVQCSSIALSINATDSLQRLTRIFLESMKSIGHAGQRDKQAKEMGITDKISYTLFFLLQRLEMINTKAVENKLEPICSHLVTVTGKIIIDSAKFDMTVPVYPLPYFGRFSVEAQKRGLSEVGSKAICTLLEVARTILTEVDVTYAELQPPFFSLIAQLEKITKEMFRQDKTINIRLLMQPFQDLKTLFSSEKMRIHQDTPPIVADIDRVLAEFSSLEQVMKTMPPIPLISEDLTQSKFTTE